MFPKDYEKMIYVEPFVGAGHVLYGKKKSEVEIINDNGVKKFYPLETEITTYFVDITSYVREEKINQLIQ